MACIMPISLDSFKKVGNRDLKMPYERKKVETFTIDARNRITSGSMQKDRQGKLVGLVDACVVQYDWVQIWTHTQSLSVAFLKWLKVPSSSTCAMSDKCQPGHDPIII
jgi:hypothetical protein